MRATTLRVDKACVESGLVTESEYGELLDCYRELLPVEGRMKVRNVTLMPCSVAVAACQV